MIYFTKHVLIVTLLLISPAFTAGVPASWDYLFENQSIIEIKDETGKHLEFYSDDNVPNGYTWTWDQAGTAIIKDTKQTIKTIPLIGDPKNYMLICYQRNLYFIPRYRPAHSMQTSAATAAAAHDDNMIPGQEATEKTRKVGTKRKRGKEENTPHSKRRKRLDNEAARKVGTKRKREKEENTSHSKRRKRVDADCEAPDLGGTPTYSQAMDAGQEFLNNLDALPPELQTFITSKKPLSEILELNKNTELRNILKTEQALITAIPTQFAKAIDKLFTIISSTTPTGENEYDLTINDLDNDIRDFHIQSLMEVLRALHDHKYYGISEAIYQHIIEKLKNSNLWTNNSQNNRLLLYKIPSNYKIISSILMEIFNHFDGCIKKYNAFIGRSFEEFDNSNLPNIHVELYMHKKNDTYSNQRLQAYTRSLMKLLIQKPSVLTDETKARLLSFSEIPRPDLYYDLSPFILYALKNPGKNIKILETLVKCDENKKQYLLKKDADSEILNLILEDAKKCNTVIITKASVYKLYIKRDDADPEVIQNLLADTFHFTYESTKANIYSCYIKDKKANPEIIQNLLANTFHFKDETAKANIYSCYIKDKKADPKIIQNLLSNTFHFKDETAKEKIYTSYISRMHPYQEEILKDTNKFNNEKIKIGIYKNYKKYFSKNIFILGELIDYIENTNDDMEKSEFYETYIKHPQANDNKVINLTINALNFAHETARLNVYLAYMSYKNIDPEIMKLITENSKTFTHDYSKIKFNQALQQYKVSIS